tara:strand:+ start:92 stop:628 length:537 start_codon:yes stop_codon:yes gene_type:complete
MSGEKFRDFKAKFQETARKTLTKKVMVGAGDQDVAPVREIGDKWTDSEGNEWEQREGYKVKNSRMPAKGMFDKVCKDCDTPCTDKRDRDTHTRMDRCFCCQIIYENDLKSMKIGEKGNKWQFWVKLQVLRRWESIDAETESKVEEMQSLKFRDDKLTNALANNNVREAIEKNKKLTGG